MEKLLAHFKLKEHGTDGKTEVIAGITTFLSMAYILAVNPSMLADAGMDQGAVFTATAVSAAIATIIMGVFANYPVALASGMGLNAYFAYTVCPMLTGMGITDPWKVALTAILVEGVIFIILSIFKFRETLVNAVPANLKYGISAGIGLFISIVGLKGAGIVTTDAFAIVGEDGAATVSSSTLVALGNLGSAEVVLAFVGLILIGVMWHFKIKGSILWGILATWVLGIIAQLCGWYQGFSLIPDFSGGFLPPSLAPTFFQFDFGFVAGHFVNFAAIVFAFLFVDLFDTVGTLIGVADQGGLLNKKGELPNAGPALMSDAIGTVAGAVLGTSTVTSYVESTAGVAEGGRTGLTAISTAIFFVLALFLSPIFLAIPSFATTPALLFVGLLMMKSVLKMKFEGDIADIVGGFLALIMMPFTYSIANGIMFGILAWVVLKVCTGKVKDVHPVMWVAFALFVLRIITLVMPA